MHSTLEQLNLIKNKVNDIINKKQINTRPKIIVVTNVKLMVSMLINAKLIFYCKIKK